MALQHSYQVVAVSELQLPQVPELSLMSHHTSCWHALQAWRHCAAILEAAALLLLLPLSITGVAGGSCLQLVLQLTCVLLDAAHNPD